jgi:hypothetical protein
MRCWEKNCLVVNEGFDPEEFHGDSKINLSCDRCSFVLLGMARNP